MTAFRVFTCSALLAQSLLGAGCSSKGKTPCSSCDAGLADLALDLPALVEDAPSSQDVIWDAAMNDRAPKGDAAITETFFIDSSKADTREASAGEVLCTSSDFNEGCLFSGKFYPDEPNSWKVVVWPDAGAKESDWSVILSSDSGPVYSQGTLDTSVWHIAYESTITASDQIIEAQVRILDFYDTSPSYMAVLFGRYVPPPTDSGYFVALRGDGSLIIRKRERGKNSSWDSGVDVGIKIEQWYTIRMEIVGSAIHTFLDGNLVYSVVDDSPLPAGNIAFGTFGAIMEIKQVLLAKP
jgi:hypothetical protein